MMEYNLMAYYIENQKHAQLNVIVHYANQRRSVSQQSVHTISMKINTATSMKINILVMHMMSMLTTIVVTINPTTTSKKNPSAMSAINMMTMVMVMV